jgi:integrase
MPTINLTVKAVAKLKAPTASGKQELYWDQGLRGFGLLLSGVSNARTYVVQREVAGKTRRVSIGPANVLPLDEARERAQHVLAEFYQGKDPKAKYASDTSLQETLDGYLQARKNLRPASIINYRDAIERCLEPWLDLPLRSITPDMVEGYHRELQKQVAKDTRHQGHAMANRALATFGTLWNFAARRDPTLPVNPVRLRLERQWFPIPRRERHVTVQQLPKFYAAMMELPNPIARDYLLLLLFTGMRRTEAATLTWDDVDFGSKVIRVSAMKTKAGRKLELPMTDLVHDLLVRRRQLGKDKFVFPANANHGHIVDPKHPLRLIAQASGIEISAHDLRRTYITTAESCDISWSALKLLVNHQLEGVTGGYVQVTPERLREPAQKVCDKLKELCGVAGPQGKNVKLLRAKAT